MAWLSSLSPSAGLSSHGMRAMHRMQEGVRVHVSHCVCVCVPVRMDARDLRAFPPMYLHMYTYVYVYVHVDMLV